MDNRIGSVSFRSEDQIEQLARMVRRHLGVPPDVRLSMRPILEHYLDDMVEGAYLQISYDKEMMGAEGRTDWHRPVITLSASTYADLRRDDYRNRRPRMTAAHELGHLLMHTQQPIFHYRTRSRDRHVDPEWQANYFAAALLMPRESFRHMKKVSEAMERFGVSRGAVLCRARGLKMKLIDVRTHKNKERKPMRRAP